MRNIARYALLLSAPLVLLSSCRPQYVRIDDEQLCGVWEQTNTPAGSLKQFEFYPDGTGNATNIVPRDMGLATNVPLPSGFKWHSYHDESSTVTVLFDVSGKWEGAAASFVYEDGCLIMSFYDEDSDPDFMTYRNYRKISKK